MQVVKEFAQKGHVKMHEFFFLNEGCSCSNLQMPFNSNFCSFPRLSHAAAAAAIEHLLDMLEALTAAAIVERKRYAATELPELEKVIFF